MDQLLIKGLKLEASIGCLAWEKRSKQKLLLDIEIHTNCSKAAGSDDLADTVNYATLVEELQALVSERHFNLVETLAETIAGRLLSNTKVAGVDITLLKPEIIPNCKAVGVRIQRRRDEG